MALKWWYYILFVLAALMVVPFVFMCLYGYLRSLCGTGERTPTARNRDDQIYASSNNNNKQRSSSAPKRSTQPHQASGRTKTNDKPKSSRGSTPTRSTKQSTPNR